MPAVLTDFGLARLAATGSRLTRTGQALGTPAYMSPEQARGETAALTPATDVWALGCVLYELLAARRPFGGETPAEVIGRVLTAEPPDMRAIRPDVPPGLAAVVAGCLAKSAGHRYPSARELREDCDRVLRGERVRARPPRRLRATMAVTVAAAVAVAGAVAGAVARWGDRSLTDSATPSNRPVAESDAEAFARQARERRHSEPREAARLLEAALDARPDRHDWRLELGLLRWAVGAGPLARTAWDAIPADAPEGPRARLYRGLEAFSRLRPQDAIPDLAPLAETPGDVGRLAKGALAALSSEWPAARAALAGLSRWEAALLRGFVDAHDPAADRAAAVVAYDAAIAEGIAFAWALSDRGVAKQQSGDRTGALRDYDAAIALDPHLFEGFVNRASARFEQGDATGAIADYGAALALRPEYVRAWINRGALRQGGGDLVGAIADYDAALARDPRHTEALTDRGNAKQLGGDLAGAHADFEAALAVDPRFVDALFNRGLLRQASGDVSGALADYDAALEGNPQYLGARVNRAAVRRERGDLAGTIVDLDAILALVPGDYLVLADRAMANLASGNAAAAIPDLVRTLEVAPPDWPGRPDVTRYLAEARAALARGAR